MEDMTQLALIISPSAFFLNSKIWPLYHKRFLAKEVARMHRKHHQNPINVAQSPEETFEAGIVVGPNQNTRYV